MSTKRDLRIVFMGTPDFAVATLKALIDHDYKVVGVITAPDRPAGRGQKLKASAVKAFALENNLYVLQPTNLKTETFLDNLKVLNANLQVIVAFRMLPKVVWQMPMYGTFNLHASLLPDYRGAAPIHWAIINGEEKTGVTTFFIDEKIDTGAIILKEEIAIAKNETAGTLHDKLMALGSKLVIETVKQIENNTIETLLQPSTKDLRIAHKLGKDNCKIDWNLPVDTVYNKIRGLNPYPTAWCYLKNGNATLTIKLYNIIKEHQVHDHEFGILIIEDNTLKVACTNGYVIIEELQLPGKRKMDTKSLLNGFKFKKNAKLL
jgi:methionyl-tRNA formyltransferase